MPSLFSFHLSWKQKLTIVIAITLIGLVLVSGSAYMGFQKVDNSVNKQIATAEYKQLSLTFANSLLKLESSESELTTEKTDTFKQNISELLGKVKVLKQKAGGLGYAEMVTAADKLASVADSYFTVLGEWLNNQQALGFTLKDGQKSLLVASGLELKRLSFTMTKEQIDVALAAQSGYLNTLNLEDEAHIDQALGNLLALVKNMEWEENLMGKSIIAYSKEFNATKSLVNNERQLQEKMKPIFVELNQLITKQNSYLDDVVSAQVLADANQARTSAVKVMLISSASVGLMIFISLGRIASQLNVQLKQMQEFLKGVAEGDFTQQLALNDNEKDEFTQLRDASNHMTQDISSVISRVVKGNEALRKSRNQLEQIVKELASSSDEVERKAHSSREATHQISLAVNDVAKRSVEVRETSQVATNSTKSGGKVISDSVESMVNISELINETHSEVSHLSESSTKMLGIVDVINSLADQTNLLALNAAIESARAGEAGRGFSVVADEVRALAQKTVGATSGISSIIKTLNNQSKRMTQLMDKGIDLASAGQDNANNAMAAIETIESAIQKVTAEMDQVVVAVEEISYNTGDIAKQVEQISDESENNKRTRLSLEEHTQHVSTQVEELEALTSRFKLSRNA
jgi:methyl-accepting chemotaxis protein